MELEPPTSAWQPLGSQTPMFLPPERPRQEACPCGEEPLDAPSGAHVVGPDCRAQIGRQVQRRFGAHRFGGRFAHDVEDIVQDCYVKLTRPGGLDSFRAPPDRPRVAAFRSWLSGVVTFHCNNKQKGWTKHPTDVLENPPELMGTETPEQAFVRRYLIELAESAVADVEPRWREKGVVWSARFDVFLPFVLGEDGDYERAQKRLGIEYENAKQLKWKLGSEIRLAARARLLDELPLEPGLSPAAIEAKIDEAIEDLLSAAFPAKTDFTLGFLAPEPEPQPEVKPEPDGAPPESKP